jgi:hypothetical protein
MSEWGLLLKQIIEIINIGHVTNYETSDLPPIVYIKTEANHMYELWNNAK